MANIAFVSTYPPQLCGIATFTADLAAATGSHALVSLWPPGWSDPFATNVAQHIRRDVPGDYLRAARWLDGSGADVVSIQHEYGIWGGPDGAQVLDFVRALRTPSVATLHTVLQRPTSSQRRILTELVGVAAATVVMSTSAAELLTRAYGIHPARVEVVPHGVPDLPMLSSDMVKPTLDLSGRRVILSFGLLGPGKGYEAAISAMPKVVRAAPDALYVIVGATHPELLRREGESYRRRLEMLAASLGVADHVRFEDRFVDAAELGIWLLAADVFVTPYPNLEQIVSGTLSYAMGAGKAIVSTPYAYANERLAMGRGRLVEPGSIDSLAQALVELLLDQELRTMLGQRAYLHTRGMRWPEVAATYRQIFDGVAQQHTRAASPRTETSIVAMARA